jgi:hypothetical protein
MNKTASQIITDHLDRLAIQSKITQMKGAKVTANNAVAFALEYNKVRHFVQSSATQRKLDNRYRKAVAFIQATVDSAREFRDAVRADRLDAGCETKIAEAYKKSEDLYEHLGNCPTTSGVAFDGECACYETKLEMKGGRA